MDFLHSLIKANMDIYDLLKNTPHSVLSTKLSKGFGGDISTHADLEAEKIFIKYLKNFGSIYSEECGTIEGGDELIIIDPIDGSENFISNIPFYGTSVAKKSGDITTHGVIANLANGDLYVKSEELFEKRSLFRDTKTSITTNNNSSTGIFEKSYASKKFHNFLQKSSLKYRSMGSLALSLSLAHEVNFVLYEGNVREFDIAAGWYMCEDLFRFRGDNFLLVSKDKGIFDKIANFIKEQSVNGLF